MGIYLNPGNDLYLKTYNDKVFVDHSLLIELTNKVNDTGDNMLCILRPRQFGKSTDVNMLVAYYSKGCDSKKLFDSLKISKSDSYLKHLNQYQVIYLNMQQFLSRNNDVQDMIQDLTESIYEELELKFENIKPRKMILSMIFERIYSLYSQKFIFIIDEWDSPIRNKNISSNEQEYYLDFLRDLLKDKPYVSLAYMTGILPIKKFGTHNGLNMFEEISMIDSGPYAQFMGFTEEVCDLCRQHDVSFEDMKSWYDGYHLTDEISTFSPRSVIMAVTRKEFGNYWTSTETYEALKVYIDMNFDGLKDDIIELLSGESISVQTSSFQNDMTTFKLKDDVLTLLIHLGYLGYIKKEEKAYIPNREVSSSFINSIEDSNWKETTKALLNSRELLEATWNKEEEKVAKYIEEVHLDTSILTYNNENALAYTLSLAYISARDHYTIIREMPTGKGFADLVFIPMSDKPAMIIEIKWDQEVETAITQIKDKKYPKVLEHYKDNLLLVGIIYDRKTKEHVCRIVKVTD